GLQRGRMADRIPEPAQILAARSVGARMGQQRVLIRHLAVVVGAERLAQRRKSFGHLLTFAYGSRCKVLKVRSTRIRLEGGLVWGEACLAPTSRLLRRKPPRRGDTSAAALRSERISISSRPALARRAGHRSDALRIVLRCPPLRGGEPISTGKIGMENLLADWASGIGGRLIFQNEIDHAFHLVVVDPTQAVL